MTRGKLDGGCYLPRHAHAIGHRRPSHAHLEGGDDVLYRGDGANDFGVAQAGVLNLESFRARLADETGDVLQHLHRDGGEWDDGWRCSGRQCEDGKQ